ncbi:hypothetical protein [Klebsiella michiganensis]|uniref:hypothetical protein n=1 Tax=Klebsiella michiganensis TaxID=1134687 RepID=UPI000FEBD720|nr:hypothetical protein [Klebsiella michiganensis]MDH1763998.1 hypothetical protein [Klebsiella michiganensis]RWT41981.1 hypothetical protein DN619_19195 [Klebsiella michiganensis]
MTTDITELAQRVKTEASVIDDTHWYLAKPSEIRSLVEALEKAQQERENWRTSFDNERFRADKLATTLSNEIEQSANVRGQLLIAHSTLLNQQAKISELEEAEQKLCAANVTLDARAELAERQLAELESRTVKLPEGDERDDLVISITEEIAHLQRCVERYRKEGMASTTQVMEQRLLVQQIALSVLNSAAGIKWEAE